MLTCGQSIANIRGIRAMALDSTFRDKFQTDAVSAKGIGQRDAWVIAIGAAMSAALPLFVQGESLAYFETSTLIPQPS